MAKWRRSILYTELHVLIVLPQPEESMVHYSERYSLMMFTCIIPFFNERDRILTVLKAVDQIRGIDEIICADDGSTDDTADIVKRHYPHVLTVYNKRNLGKTDAVKSALKQAKGKYILLLDADLQNLHKTELEKAVATVNRDKKLDMMILRRINSPFGVKVPFYDVLLCGQRILRKDDLLKTLDLYQPHGYELEIALNQYMVENHKNVCIMPISFINTGSMKKMGIVRGIYKNIYMPFKLVLGYIGLTDTIKQLLFFYGKENQAELPSAAVK